MDAVAVHRYGQQTFDAAVDAIPADAWLVAGACGTWSVKDIVAHLASYECVLADIASGFGRPTPTPDLDRFLALGDAFNDAAVAARAVMSMAKVRAELTAASERTLDALGALPAAERARSGTLPWYGAEYSLDDLLVYMDYGHKREHAAQVAVFGDR